MKNFKHFILLSLLVSNSLFARSEHFLKVDGPNSLNAVMVFTGLAKNYRYASSNELRTILNSPLCRNLSKTEARKNGDIGIIKDIRTQADKNIITHAFVLLDSGLAFHKNGGDKNSSYETLELSSILKNYSIFSESKLNDFESVFYRCQNLEQFLTLKKSSIRRHTLTYFRELEKIESNLQDYLDNIESASYKNKYLEIEREVQILSGKMTNVSESTASEENLLVKIIASRLVSIAGQLSALNHPEFFNQVVQWENQDKNIEEIFEIFLNQDIQDDLDLLYAGIRKNFISIYGPIVKEARNVDLNVGVSTEYPTNAGGVSLYKNEARIEMGSDMHRNLAVSPDIYLAILCHEVGHILGGTPYSLNTLKPSSQWQSTTPSSSEGQSDFFSSLTCMKKVFASDTPTVPTSYNVSDRVKALCENKFETVLEQNICQRSAAAGFGVASYIISVYDSLSPGQPMAKISMDTPEKDGTSVGKLYPSLQCRFDTILAGALNQKRPGCWFKE